ncbi:ATPase, T2SS/T4P/T4SS family [Vibrio mediterranei]
MAETQTFPEEIRKDERLYNLICERSDCYINDNGYLVTFAERANYEDVISALRESETAFDGTFFGVEAEVLLSTEADIRSALARIKDSDTASESNSQLEETNSLLQLRRILNKAVNEGLSDLHLKLNTVNKTTQLSKRKDGKFTQFIEDQNLDFGKNISSFAIVNLGKGQSFTTKSQQDATFPIELELEIVEEGKSYTTRKEIKWRVSSIPLDDGCKVTFRNLDAGGGVLPDLRTLGLAVGHVEAVDYCVKSAQGALLLSGPTGSGKTTTINSALKNIQETRVVHSLEDPVEFTRPGRNHFSTPVNEEYVDPKTKKNTRNFANYGKVLLRHDTDALYFGEVRTKEAAAQFMRLATTGQVMVGTIHCNSAIACITTVAEQLGVPTTQLAAPGIINALAHQRLVRTLCPDCKIPHEEAVKLARTDKEIGRAVSSIVKIGEQKLNSGCANQRTLDEIVSNVYYRNRKGECSSCGGAGEKGRTSLFEIIIVDDAGRDFIRDLRLNEWLAYLKSKGWPSIRDHAENKLLNGLIDYDSVVEQVDGLVEMDIEDMHKAMYNL